MYYKQGYNLKIIDTAPLSIYIYYIYRATLGQRGSCATQKVRSDSCVRACTRELRVVEPVWLGDARRDERLEIAMGDWPIRDEDGHAGRQVGVQQQDVGQLLRDKVALWEERHLLMPYKLSHGRRSTISFG